MRKEWTIEEIIELKRGYRNMKPGELLVLTKILNRSKGSIHRKANRLGLTNIKKGLAINSQAFFGQHH